mgnify:CR=1 FL=1
MKGPSPGVVFDIARKYFSARARNFAGSAIGGMKETQEMIDFCAKHNIVSDIEMIGIEDVNKAYERMVRNDVKYRFVIDIETLRKAA